MSEWNRVKRHRFQTELEERRAMEEAIAATAAAATKEVDDAVAAYARMEKPTPGNDENDDDDDDAEEAGSAGPCQPILKEYPLTQCGNRRQRFCATNFKLYPWMSYSVARNAASCFPCRKVRMSSSGVQIVQEFIQLYI